MDPLTKNLLSRIGRTPGLPKLPPVNNVRLMNLQKELQPAERDLYTARRALQLFQEAQARGANTQQETRNLHAAMAALQGREQDYFANTYTGKDKRMVIQGWREWKETEMGRKLTDHIAASGQRLTDIRAAIQLNTLHQLAEQSHLGYRRALRALMNYWNSWTAWNNGVGQRLETRPSGVAETKEIISTSRQEILGFQRQLQDIQPAPASFAATANSIQENINGISLLERLFQRVVKNHWVADHETAP